MVVSPVSGTGVVNISLVVGLSFLFLAVSFDTPEDLVAAMAKWSFGHDQITKFPKCDVSSTRRRGRVRSIDDQRKVKRRKD